MGFMSAGQSISITYIVTESSLVPCCQGRSIALTHIHEISSINARCPGNHIIAENSGVALAVEGSIQHHQFTSPTLVDGTPYHDWGATVTVRGLDSCIYLSLSLPAAHTSMITISLMTQCLTNSVRSLLPPWWMAPQTRTERPRWYDCPWS